MTQIRIKILPVFQGDAIIVDCIEDNLKILVDTGTKRAYSRGILKSEIEKTKTFDLLVLTHTDEDHIGGLIKYLDDENRKKRVFKKIWFNSGDIINKFLLTRTDSVPEISLDQSNNLDLSVKQGITLERKLAKEGILPEKLIASGNKATLKNVNFTILSPDLNDLKDFYEVWELETETQLEMTKKSDYHMPIEELLQHEYIENGTLANKTSIAFFLNYVESNFLLLGDAFSSIIERNLRKLGYNETNKLKLDLIKVSHHGSGYGMSLDLLNILDCRKYIISTNGSNGLPSKECLARIISHRTDKVFLYFNYKNDITQNIFSLEDYKKYSFELIFLTTENNYTISIGEKN